MTDVFIELDENNRDVLYVRREEVFRHRNPDGTPSPEGRVIWHTEWWHYSGSVVRGQTLGPRIERTFAELFADGGLPPGAILDGLHDAFIKHARQDLGLTTLEIPDAVD